MLKRVVLAVALMGLVGLSWAHVSAQVPRATPIVSGETRRIRVLRISEPIKIDGHLDESAWSEAVAATDFRQQEPNEGTPASEKTEVRVLFDDRNLYIGIHAFDSDPANINARELVRDASFSNDDKVEVLLDT
ncbi:MAG TPA: sugar-binding protein, partial [Pyrinomonadaceae bacterium]|nr:sugar-binding protein [Pyrinomonadaceae bacterium]